MQAIEIFKDSVAPIGLLGLLCVALAASAIRGDASAVIAERQTDTRSVVHLAHDAEVPAALSFRPIASDTLADPYLERPATRASHALMRIEGDEALPPAARMLLEDAANALGERYLKRSDRLSR